MLLLYRKLSSLWITSWCYSFGVWLWNLYLGLTWIIIYYRQIGTIFHDSCTVTWNIQTNTEHLSVVQFQKHYLNSTNVYFIVAFIWDKTEESLTCFESRDHFYRSPNFYLKRANILLELLIEVCQNSSTCSSKTADGVITY